ncbi:protein transport protein Sec24C [Galendromus occidentalis]|uniref:Protein transport protein Sec24C n=1 Tax=Galendromus occidentalis TaxID=34638 RepID=A0AAJ6VUS8_9ACAR|nr:protein transport protein Sec24C [Galendromus occidentalis]
MPPPVGGPPTGAQNGLYSGPTSAFQPPPQTHGQPPAGPPQGYNMGSPMSPPGQYNPQAIGQGYAASPPNMYNQQNGQYPPSQHPQHLQSTGGYPQQPAAPQRKLDPDQMPSPIQVIEDDRKNAGPVFGTNRLGTLPPLVTTDVEIQDEGNAGPNYIRSTVYSVPCSPDVIKQTQVPLAVAITPFARHAKSDGVLPLSVFNEEIVRCNRCKAYMCPFMQFLDGGRRFQCVFCKATTEVPQSYFNHLDHNGARVDKWQRAELCLGSYEILATQEYCKNNVLPKAAPAFIFIVDVSYNAIKNGMVQLFCQNIRDILEDLPTEDDEPNETPAIRVGFITYSSQVHFYNIDPNLSSPRMMVVPDVSDMFVPLLEGCLVKPSEASRAIESLCEEIPKMFGDTRETETILGPAIEAGMEALKAAECPGKLFVLHTTMPTLEAPGKLKNRDDRKLLGTEKEKTVLAPACPYYQELATQCVQAGCSVDLFIANNSFVDVASIGQVAKISGGEVFKYTYFQADTDGERFIADLRRDVARPVAFDAVLRVRTSTGLRPTDFYGNFYMQNTTDVELASIDCDKCITVEMKYDDKLPEGECAFIQAALLYTSVKGIRKLRLHNLCLQTTSQMADMFRNCELDTILNLFCKQGLRQLMDGNPKSLREGLTLRASTILANYRKHCATASSSGQLILPECMKLMPLYVCCMMKSDALAGGPELTIDDRAYAMLCLGSMDVKSSQIYLYPRLLAVTDLDPSDNSIPTATRTTVEKIRENEAYILENGVMMFLYIGLQVDPIWCESIFGVRNVTQIQVERTLPLLNNPRSKHLHELIASIRNERQRFMKLYIVRQGDKWERVLRQFLIEDRMSDTQPSYVDYLCQLHREIRGLI